MMHALQAQSLRVQEQYSKTTGAHDCEHQTAGRWGNECVDLNGFAWFSMRGFACMQGNQTSCLHGISAVLINEKPFRHRQALQLSRASTPSASMMASRYITKQKLFGCTVRKKMQCRLIQFEATCDTKCTRYTPLPLKGTPAWLYTLWYWCVWGANSTVKTQST